MLCGESKLIACEITKNIVKCEISLCIDVLVYNIIASNRVVLLTCWVVEASIASKITKIIVTGEISLSVDVLAYNIIVSNLVIVLTCRVVEANLSLVK